MSDVTSELIPALRSLVVALGGVLMAFWWFRGDWLLSLVLVAAIMLLGIGLEWLGEGRLPGHPVAAVRLMEWWALVPMSLGAAASAAVIAVSVELTLPESVKDPQVKETVGALSTAISAFLTAALISSLGDRDKSAVGDRIRDRLRRHYTRDAAMASKTVKYVEPGSDAEQYLQSEFFQGLSGWDRETRLRRAHGVAKSI